MIKFLVPLLILAASPLMAAEAVFLGAYTWHVEKDVFGGFSSIELSEDGQRFIGTSDRGAITQGTLKRKEGVIIAIENYRFRPLLDTKGRALKDHFTDAEGLAINRHGQIFVSFEASHRVWRYDNFGGKAQKLSRHAGFEALQNNSGLEALAIDQFGTLYTLPERSGEWERPFPVFRFQGGKWDNKLTIPRRDRFLPVGADFGPDGKFYLLERDFIWYAGFTTRIRRFDVTSAGFTNEEILLTTRSGAHGNLEGIALWQDDQERIRLTMISDDNFSVLLTTDFVEYVVVP